MFFFWSGWSDLSSPFFFPPSIPVVPLSHQLLFIDSKLGEEETEGRAGRAVTLRGVTLLLFFLYFLDSSFSHFLSILQSSSVSEQFSFKCEESRFLNTVGSVCLFLPLASRFFSCLQQLRSSSSTYGIRKKTTQHWLLWCSQRDRNGDEVVWGICYYKYFGFELLERQAFES